MARGKKAAQNANRETLVAEAETAKCAADRAARERDAAAADLGAKLAAAEAELSKLRKHVDHQTSPALAEALNRAEGSQGSPGEGKGGLPARPRAYVAVQRTTE